MKKIEHAPLEAVYIYFGTATYDEIERDVKVTLENFVKDTIREINSQSLKDMQVG